MNKVARIVTGVIQEAADNARKEASPWDNALYGGIKELEIDARGRIGERIVVALLTAAGRAVSHSDATSEDKHWDLMCDGLTYEVKGATLGKNGVTFQHENIYKTRLYDGLIFVDIAPNDIYITGHAKKSIVWGDLHHRKDSSFYKWDTHLRATRKHPVLQNRIGDLQDFVRIFTRLEAEIRAHKARGKAREEL